jgi:selenocysteine lyase/cysteine desulfurase
MDPFKKHQWLLICIFLFIRNGRWLVLIDAAKGSATMPPDLSKYPVDFVALSFYKVYKIYV